MLLQERLVQQVTVRDVARSGAEYFRELLDALFVSETTHENGYYRELASVGVLPPPNRWYPPESVYPDSVYPLTTQQLKEHGGYFTSTLDDPAFVELVGAREDPDVVSVLGVAMVTAGHFRGEVFVTRGREQVAFDREDLGLALDLATSMGSSLVNAATRQ